MLNGEYSALAAGSTTGQRENAVPTLRAAPLPPSAPPPSSTHPNEQQLPSVKYVFIGVSSSPASRPAIEASSAATRPARPARHDVVGCRDFYFECMNRTAAPRTTRAPLRAAPHHQIRFSQVSPSAQATARIKMGDPPPAGNARRQRTASSASNRARRMSVPRGNGWRPRAPSTSACRARNTQLCVWRRGMTRNSKIT